VSLPVIDGLDTSAGLASVGGRVASYLRVLGMFIEHHTDDLERIRDALREGSREEARRLAHSLKGTAATLGAEPLREAALTLEMAIKSTVDAATIETAMSAVAPHLNALLVGLRAHFAPLNETVAPASVVRPIDDADRALLASLKTYLQGDDLRASTLWLAQQERLAELLGPAEKQIRKAIESYDFAGALKRFNQVQP